ncbi:isoleucine-trna ligase [Plasmopara halstedii]|uniref:isoleucine--tRNA ligase n=1 Tax=Plasmopara halstedii TaxID=4781 RepID=A0A0P1AIC2_PLAHL|nr:isoleucine-trna ligase [Plasmopara halstedii]CEG40940.1 isoleucine-trna ligase [Plasmopara halstedii]|eukprot:XP_024577309.1 isoleucine-trna ligase [Plasmopara halstedii]
MPGGKDSKALATAMRLTLNLPTTRFPMRANAAVREPQLHARCVTAAYREQAADSTRPLFVLHDGPPFANGSLHMGHFLNKTLKDIINRYQVLRGRRVVYVPGWDCHGLPIEHKALTLLQLEANDLTPVQIRALSRQLARQAVQEQQKDFERWGVLADWSGDPDSIYLTMNPSYEAKQYDVLKKMVVDKLIFRGFKPVYWSPSSRTALAEAELEYQDDHVSKAAYIQFPFASIGKNTDEETAKVLSKYQDTLSAVVWTTTPWTIPSNQALCVNADLKYVIVRPCHVNSDACYLIASELLQSFALMIKSDVHEQVELNVLETLNGADLAGVLFTHPLTYRQAVVLLGEHVTTDAGTGIVHTAPGHGQDDYRVWMAHHSKDGEHPNILCPVDAAGCFTAEAGQDLEGLCVLDEGNNAVIELLKKTGNLLAINNHHHRYPYDWRTKKPVILRATAQWFARLDALHARGTHVLIDSVKMVPSSARRRLEATLSSRNEWCISRQRAWGLPIPVFYDKVTGEPMITTESIEHLQSIVKTYRVKDVSGVVEREGADCWWDLSVHELLPPSLQHQADRYEKGTDTLDVWFDSGTSWHAVLTNILRPEKHEQIRADVYLEGSDQHRGWFQSSLLTSLAMQDTAPYKTVITHGFTLDERGSKMSKSLGNTIVPNDFINGCEMSVPVADKGKRNKSKKIQNKSEQIVNVKQIKVPAYGADVLRFWVATTDYTSDVSIGPGVVSKASDALRKVRNTARFLLGNLYDFDPSQHAISYDKMDLSLDRYMLHELNSLAASVTVAYDSYAFNRAQHALSHFISTDLSAFYMEATKDRLYCDAADAKTRRSAQTILWLSLQALTRALAPVAPHTAEDIRLYWQSQLHGDIPLENVCGSIFLEHGWMPSATEWKNDGLARDWTAIRQLRFEVNRVVEQMRQSGRVGSQLECNVYVVDPQSDSRVTELLSSLIRSSSELADVFLCSGVDIVTSEVAIENTEQFKAKCRLDMGPTDPPMDVEFVVTPARGHKCPRCWKYALEVDVGETQLCFRCAQATDRRSVTELMKELIE